MTVHAQNSCTLSHITDVQAVYTYYYLASSDITSNMAPKDNVNAPGASTIRITYNGVNYDWTLTEPTLNIVDDVIQTAVGKLYFMECTLFSDSTYDWGPLMTSSTYAAAKAAYNLSSQALANASAAKAVTDLMGGHFIYGNAIPHTSTSAGARVVEQIEEDDVDLTTTPSKWHHNVNIGANGIQLRYNEAVMAQLAANQSENNTALKFYKPPSISGNTTTQGALAMELTANALKFYNSSDGTTEQAVFSNEGIKLGQEQKPHVEIKSNKIDFYGFYYPKTSGTTTRQFGVIGQLGESCQFGNDNDAHIIISNTGFDLYSNASSLNVALKTRYNYVNYTNYKKRFKTTWEYGTLFNFSFSTYINQDSFTFYVEKDGKFESTGSLIVIDDTEYPLTMRAISTGKLYNYTFTSGNSNEIRTVNVMVELSGSASLPGPRFQFGINNNSIGPNSCTIGEGLTALGQSQIVLGQYNEPDFNAAFVIGNGTSSNHSNLFVIDGDGNLSVKDGFKITNDENAELALNSNGIDIKQNNITLAHIGYDQGVDADGHTNTYAPYYTFGKRKTTTTAYNSSSTYSIGDMCVYDEKKYVCITNITTPEEWTRSHWQYYRGNFSIAEGFNTTASGYGSHAEGDSTIASGSYSTAEGFGTTASAYVSHAEGEYTTASGYGSHAEGISTTASNTMSHAEGVSTIADGQYSHAEGAFTIAKGTSSHAEGDSTIANETNSHAGGYYTVAGYANQTVIGKYNNNKSNTAFEIGNGNDTARSNALTVDWNGQVQSQGISSLDDSYKEIYVKELTETIKTTYRLTSSNSDSEWLQAALKLICNYYPKQTFVVFKGRIAPNSQGYFEVFIYDTSKLSNGIPQYACGTWRKWPDAFGIFKTNQYAFSYTAK